MGGRPAGGKAGAGLDKMRPGGLGGLAGLHLFLIGQQAGLNDDLDGVPGRSLYHALNIPLHQRPIADFRSTHMDDHIQLLGAHGGTAGGFGGFLLRGNGAQGEPHYAANLYTGPFQQAGGQRNINRIDTHTGKVILRRFGAQLLDLGRGGLGL